MDVHIHIKAWIDGDDRAFRRIFDHFFPRLYAAALKMTAHSVEAEELAMNVFTNLWRYRAQLSSVNDFSAYLYGILKNQVIAAARKNVPVTEELETVAAERAASVYPVELSFKELEARYRAAVDRLPEKRREVFLMSREQGLSHQEISLRQHISVNTVNNHIKAALSLIREDLRDYQYLLPFILMLSFAY